MKKAEANLFSLWTKKRKVLKRIENIFLFLELCRKWLKWMNLREKGSCHISFGRLWGEPSCIIRKGYFSQPLLRTCNFFSNLSFGGMHTPFDFRNRGCHSKNLLPRRSAVCLSHFSKTPILKPAGIQVIKKKVCCAGCLHL